MRYIKMMVVAAILSGSVYAQQNIKVSGYLRNAYDISLSDSTYVSNFYFKNVAIDFMGNINDMFSVFVETDLSSNFLTWALMNIKFSDAFNLSYGKMVVPFGIELYTPPFNLLTPNYSLVSLATFFGNYQINGIDIGASIHGKLPFVKYAFGIYNGSTNDKGYSMVSRLEVTPPLPVGNLTFVPSFYIGDNDVQDINLGLTGNFLGASIIAEYLMGSNKVDSTTTIKGGGFQVTAAYKISDIAGVDFQPVLKFSHLDYDKSVQNDEVTNMELGLNLYKGPFKFQLFYGKTTYADTTFSPDSYISTLMQIMF